MKKAGKSQEKRDKVKAHKQVKAEVSATRPTV
jgi:hypothetical protein